MRRVRRAKIDWRSAFKPLMRSLCASGSSSGSSSGGSSSSCSMRDATSK